MIEKYFNYFVFFFFVALFALLSLLNYQVPFVYDDVPQVLGNAKLYNLFDFLAIMNDPYRPSRLIQNITFAFNAMISLNRPWSYHLFNNLFHLLNTVLVFKLLGSFGVKQRFILFFTCLIFFVHPLQIEPVTYIMGRVELLKTFTTLVLIYLYLHHTKRRFLIYFILILSLLVKETCALVPLLFLAIDVIIYQKPLRTLDWKNHLLYLSHPLWFYVFAFFIRFDIHSGVTGFSLFPVLQYCLSNLYYLLFYFYLFLNPSEQAIYHEWNSNPSYWTIAFGGIVYLGCLYFLLKKYRQYPRLAFAMVFFLLSFLPNNSILQYVNPFAEYRLYQSNIVLGLFIVILVHFLFSSARLKIIIISLMASYFLVFHFFHLRTWKHTFFIWSYALEKYPNSITINTNIGVYYLKKNFCKTAEKYFLHVCSGEHLFSHQIIACSKNLLTIELGKGNPIKAYEKIQALENNQNYEKEPSYYRTYLFISQFLKNRQIYEKTLLKAQKDFPHIFGEMTSKDYIATMPSDFTSPCFKTEK